jgi:hypothetical protein
MTTEETTSTEIEQRQPPTHISWRDINIWDQDHAEQGTLAPEGYYPNRYIYNKGPVSNMGYEIAAKSTGGTDWDQQEPYYAFRLFSRNGLGVVEYTPWIPVSDNADAQQAAMWAFTQLLRSGKLPQVNERGQIGR